MRDLRVVVLLAALLSSATADLYLQNFNNNRGGYNVGEKTSQATQASTDPDGFNAGDPVFGPLEPWTTSVTPTARQYQMVFLEGSEMLIEWTAQHGCAGGESGYLNNCNYILQFTCDTDPANVTDPALQVRLRDGANTNQPNAPNAPTTPSSLGLTEITNAITTNDGPTEIRGRHENEYAYWECETRARNQYLFLADRANNLNGQTARFTRQNNNGGRSGLECPEERDYYPYWSPSIWRDIAYLTDNITVCNDIVLPNSQNHNMKYKCVAPGDSSVHRYPASLYSPIFPDLCANSIATGPPQLNGVWQGSTHNLPPPECGPAPWSRANHLGNADRGLETARYKWKLPSVDQLKGSGIKTYKNDKFARCVFRIRYNISTADFNPWTTSSRSNGESDNLGNPIAQNPVEDIGVRFQDYEADNTLNPLFGLRLAIDTDQFGRTFQDRSHVFYIHRRTQELMNGTGITDATRVHNLNVRGKRGNVVQTYPAVEYDFVPNKLNVEIGDLIHIQWTGSNTHNNNGGGDGQGGDAGQGTGGTDRSNFVQMKNLEDNYPIPQDKFQTESIFTHSECIDPLNGQLIAPLDCAVMLATGGHYRSVDHAKRSDTPRFGVLQNTSPPSFVNGVLMRFKPTASGKKFPYMATRNNSFSNRSQKGIILVS